MTRLLLGNLDCEYHYGPNPKPLPNKVLERISSAATLLRIFQPDVLWTPCPVAPDRIPEIETLDRPKFISGTRKETYEITRVWGTTRLTQNQGGQFARHERTVDNVWQCPSPTSEASERANDKSFCHRLQVDSGLSLSGAQLFTNISEFDGFDFAERWVIKPRFGVAGRNRILGKATPDASALKRLRALLDRDGCVVYEPWVKRLADYGITGFLDKNGVYSPHIHRLEVDSAGGFKGICTQGDNLSPSDQRQFLDHFERVGKALRAIDYRGPFGLDAFHYQAEDGSRRLHPVNEINARLTYGHIARAYAEHLGEPVKLRFGREIPSDALPLLRPSQTDPSAAWLS